MESRVLEKALEDQQFEKIGKELDDEDKSELFLDCYDFIDRITSRQDAQWVQNEGAKLRERLVEVLNWYKIH